MSQSFGPDLNDNLQINLIILVLIYFELTYYKLGKASPRWSITLIVLDYFLFLLSHGLGRKIINTH